MQLECEKPILEEGLQTVARAINPRSPLPILSHILIEARGDQLTLTATDLDLGVCLKIPATIHVEGSLACPAKLLLEIVSKLPGAPVTLTATEGRVQILCGRSKFEITTLPAEEFPSLPSGERYPEIALPQREFRAMVKKVGIATAASDESRAVMTGILTQLEGDQLVMVATDGRRLAFAEHRMPNALDVQAQVIVPGRAMQELARIAGDNDEPLFLRLADNQMFCTLRNVSMHCRLLEGHFPDYRRVMPTEFQRGCRVGREALLAALRRMLIVAQERQSPNLIVLDLASERLQLSANTPDLGLGQEEVAVIFEGQDLRIAFNGKYMQELLTVLDCEEIQMDLQDDTRSAVLRPYGQTDFRYVLMPVRLREAVAEEPEAVGASA